LEIHDGGNIAIADTPAAFAKRCLDLLDNAPARHAIAQNASRIVAEKYSWESVTKQFERLLV
jgi:glycosyltransferase involved in cell wall biosynthesis